MSMTEAPTFARRGLWLAVCGLLLAALLSPATHALEQPASRYYDSMHVAEGPFGMHWSSSLDVRAVHVGAPGGYFVNIRIPGRDFLKFHESGYHVFERVSGTDGELTIDELDLYTLTFKSGEVWTFDEQYRLAFMRSKEGVETSLEYDGLGRLQYVLLPNGLEWTFAYNAQNKISSITDGVLTWSFTYDAIDNLVGVDYPDGGHVAYTYEDENSPHYLTSGTNKEGVVVNEYTYDMFGRLTSHTRQGTKYIREYATQIIKEYPEGNPDAYSQSWFDSMGHLTSYRTPDGSVTESRYNVDGLLMTQLDAEGNETIFSYDDTAQQTGTLQPGDIVTLKEYDSEGHVVVTTDPAGNTTQHGYDGVGNLVVTTNPIGASTLYSYTTTRVVAAVTDPSGNTTTYEHDELAQLTAQVRTTGTSEIRVSYEYDVDGLRTAVIDPKGAATNYAHDDFGRVVTVVQPEVAVGGTLQTTRPVVSMQYDLEGNVDARTDALGRTVTSQYDAFGNKVAETDALGNTTLYAYSEGRLMATTDPLGRTTRYQYDATGRLERVIDALGGETLYGYDIRGNRTSVIDARGNETLTSYDSLGRTIAVTYPDGATLRMAYDSVGNLLRTTDPLGNTTRFEYSPLGQQTAKIEPNGDRTEFEYDVTGNRTAVIRAAGTALAVRDEMTYDALGRMTQKKRAVGSPDEVTVGYEYDLAGNVTAVINGRGKRWSFAYDAGNRLVSETDPLGRTRSYFYDAAGRLVEKRDPKGQKIQYDHDPIGRVTEARYIRSDGSLENVARMTYDAVGNMTRVTDTNVDISQSFDLLNRITAINHAHLQKTQRNEWDAAGNRTAMWVDGIPNSRADYSWDSRNRLAAIAHQAMGNVAYSYNAAGQKTTLTYPNGIVCSYTYDTNGRLTSLDYRKPDNSQVFFENLTYDPRGNITQRVDDEGTHDYQYDALDQLTRAAYPDSTWEQFAYDKSGNRSSLTTAGGVAVYAVDDTDQLLSVTGPGQSEVTTFGWTPNGEMASQLASGATTPTSYTWNTRSMMTVLSMPGGQVLTYTYLPEQWLGWMLYDTVRQTSRSTLFWDADTGNLLASGGISSGNALLHGQAKSINSGWAYLLPDGTPSLTIPVTDHLGSTVRHILTTGSAGASIRFSSYGQIRQGPTDSSELPVTYAGSDTKERGINYYMRARWYSPTAGTFLARDPFRKRHPAISLYSYARGAPILFTDPFGLFNWKAVKWELEKTPLGKEALSLYPFEPFHISSDEHYVDDWGLTVYTRKGTLPKQFFIALKDEQSEEDAAATFVHETSHPKYVNFVIGQGKRRSNAYSEAANELFAKKRAVQFFNELHLYNRDLKDWAYAPHIKSEEEELATGDVFREKLQREFQGILENTPSREYWEMCPVGEEGGFAATAPPSNFDYFKYKKDGYDPFSKKR